MDSGPTSPEEAKILWQKGQRAIQESRFQEALSPLQRFIARYPGQIGYLQAHLLLAEAYAATDHPKEAISFFKNFISSTGIHLESAKARLELGASYVTLRLFDEAYLMGVELENLAARSHFPSDIRLGALLLKIEANLGLNRKNEATLLLNSAKKEIHEDTSSQLLAQLHQQELRLKTAQCAQLPSKDSLDEMQIRDQLERRGICLLEALLTFRHLLQSGDVRFSERGSKEITEAFDSYSKVCIHSLFTLHYSPASTVLERREAKRELADRLTSDCKKTSETALNFLNSWKKELPASTRAAVLQTSAALEKEYPRTL